MLIFLGYYMTTDQDFLRLFQHLKFAEVWNFNIFSILKHKKMC